MLVCFEIEHLHSRKLSIKKSHKQQMTNYGGIIPKRNNLAVKFKPIHRLRFCQIVQKQFSGAS